MDRNPKLLALCGVYLIFVVRNVFKNKPVIYRIFSILRTELVGLQASLDSQPQAE